MQVCQLKMTIAALNASYVIKQEMLVMFIIATNIKYMFLKMLSHNGPCLINAGLVLARYIRTRMEEVHL